MSITTIGWYMTDAALRKLRSADEEEQLERLRGEAEKGEELEVQPGL